MIITVRLLIGVILSVKNVLQVDANTSLRIVSLHLTINSYLTDKTT